MASITFVGSLESLTLAAEGRVTASLRVCLLGTAAAFQGPAEAFEDIRRREPWPGATLLSVAALSRAEANDPAVVREVASADVVVLLDGAVLHARSVWRDSALAEALAGSTLIAVGSVGSVLGATMIDPRGGAPTTGLGLYDGVVFSAPAGPEQTNRTRDLLGEDYVLVELGPRAVVSFDGAWGVVSSQDLVVTRAGRPADL